MAKRAFYILVILAILGCCLPVFKTQVVEAAGTYEIPFAGQHGRATQVNMFYHPGQPFWVDLGWQTEWIMPIAGKWKHLIARLEAVLPVGDTVTLTLYLNSAPTALTATFVAGVLQTSDLTHEVSCIAGDNVTICASTTGFGLLDEAYFDHALIFESTTQGQIPFLGYIVTSTATAVGGGVNYTTWSAIGGGSSSDPTTPGYEYPTQSVVPIDGTFKYLYADFGTSGPGATENVELVFKVNSANTTLALSWHGVNIPQSDLVTEIHVSAGDLVGFESYSRKPAPVASHPLFHSVCFIPDDTTQWWVTRAYSIGNLTVAADTYSPPNYGDLSTGAATPWNLNENQRDIIWPEGVRITGITAHLTAAPGVAHERTFTLRKNSDNTTITLTISDLNDYGTMTSTAVTTVDFDNITIANSIGALAPAASRGTVSFIGSALIEPTVVTLAASSITTSSALISGNVTDLGAPADNCNLWGLEWGQVSGTYTDNWEDTGAMGVGVVFSTTVTGCTAGFTYYYRAFARNPTSGYGYGLELSFTTTWECTMYENITTQEDSISESIGGSDWSFQSVTATDNHYVNFVYLLMYRVGSPTDLHVYLCNEDNATHLPILGTPLSEGTYDVSAITAVATGEWIEVYLDDSATVVAGDNYSLVVSQDAVGANDVIWLTSTTAGAGEYYHSHDAGATWTGSVRDGLFALAECPIPLAPAGLHIIAIEPDALTFSWQEISISNSDYVLVYRTDNFPISHATGTEVYRGAYTSARIDDLDCGVTYYVGLWAYASGVYSLTPSYCAATTSAGWAAPDSTDVGDTTDATILGNSPLGDFIDFIAQYGQLPQKTVGLMGYSSILIFVIVGVASYNKSVLLTIITALAGLALGVELGVFALVFLIVAVLGGLAIGTIRGGQPSGG